MSHQFYRKSIIWSQDFDTDDLEELFERTAHIKQHSCEETLLKHTVAMLFYEASTRTRFSFEKALQNLGGKNLSTENASQFSSAAKGETLEDSIRVISSYCDAIVLRHPDDDAAMRARDRLQSEGIDIPIFNAGCGGVRGQHPTQSLLDLFTIREEIGRLENLKVVMLGDHAHSRVVRSLAYMLGKYPGNEIHFISPRQLAIGGDILAYLHRHGTKVTQDTALGSEITEADVVYVTRVQAERFNDQKLFEELRSSYCLTVRMAERMRPEARIMHPLPKVDEIEPHVDRMPQAAYFRQSDNGVHIRTALLDMVLAG